MVTLTLAAGSGMAGGTVTLNLSIASTGGDQCTAVQWQFAPDNGLVTLSSVTIGAAGSGASKTLSRSGNLCIVASIGINNNVIGDGVLASATFAIGSAASGLITINLPGIVASDADANELTASGVFGSITVPGTTQTGNKGKTHIHRKYSAVVLAASAA